AIHAAVARRPDDTRLARGQVALWRAQANDAYWHGVFGGCYLPHLRRAVKTALLDAERSLVEAGAAPAVGWAREDGNGDGRAEVSVRTGALAGRLDPEAGGMLTELGFFDARLDLADVLARHPTTAAPFSVEKRVTLRDATVEVHYRIRAAERRPLAGRFAVQWNLALTAGNAPDRYLDLAERPTLGSTGREPVRSGV